MREILSSNPLNLEVACGAHSDGSLNPGRSKDPIGLVLIATMLLLGGFVGGAVIGCAQYACDDSPTDTARDDRPPIRTLAHVRTLPLSPSEIRYRECMAHRCTGCIFGCMPRCRDEAERAAPPKKKWASLGQFRCLSSCVGQKESCREVCCAAHLYDDDELYSFGIVAD